MGGEVGRGKKGGRKEGKNKRTNEWTKEQTNYSGKRFYEKLCSWKHWGTEITVWTSAFYD